MPVESSSSEDREDWSELGAVSAWSMVMLKLRAKGSKQKAWAERSVGEGVGTRLRYVHHVGESLSARNYLAQILLVREDEHR